MRNFSVFLILISLPFYHVLLAAGDNPPCFTYEVFQHRDVAAPIAINNALTHYVYGDIFANHVVLHGAPVPIQINLGQFPPPWVGVPFIGPPLPLNLVNINAVITRRLAHGVPIADQLIAELGVANGLGVITPQLRKSLTAGGYLNNMADILSGLTLGIFPPGTILGTPIPGFIPDSIVVHIAIPQRVSKNLREFSHSSLTTVLGNLTLKDKINAPYAALGMPMPDSATIVSSDHLQ